MSKQDRIEAAQARKAGATPGDGTVRPAGGPERLSARLLSWADDLDAKTLNQAGTTSKLPIIHGHVALMPDAHMGFGCAVGSVVPTKGAIIPSAVGVDIGCGMAAIKTDLTAGQLPDDLTPLRNSIEERIPAGVGNGKARTTRRADAWMSANRPGSELTTDQNKKALRQLGSLGSGNHFVEISLDGAGGVWAVLHSGSRGIGNQLAQGHIRAARQIERHAGIGNFDPELSWFVEGTPEFDAYVADLIWAQAYAWENREVMLDELADALFSFVGHGRQVERVSCHHNYAERERHDGVDIWVTRKGAIRARRGDPGIIPGSMGTDTFIVEGLGNSESFHSCSHGAGRRMSRTQAKKRFDTASLTEAMGDRVWLDSKKKALLDEHPDAYKDIEEVMAAQTDLVTVRDRLVSILNYKGT